MLGPGAMRCAVLPWEGRVRRYRGPAAGSRVAWMGSRALLGAAGALGLKPGCPVKGRMRALSGTMPHARGVELGMPGRAFLCLCLSRATPFLLLSSRVLSAILPVFRWQGGGCVS